LSTSRCGDGWPSCLSNIRDPTIQSSNQTSGSKKNSLQKTLGYNIRRDCETEAPSCNTIGTETRQEELHRAEALYPELGYRTHVALHVPLRRIG
jgi:hypothetical protein